MFCSISWLSCVELELAVAERLLPLVDRAGGCSFELFGQLREASAFRSSSDSVTSASFCSAFVAIALERLDLLGDLLELLLGVLLPLLGRLHRGLGLHQLVLELLLASARARRSCSRFSASSFCLRGKIAGGVVEAELRILPLAIQSSSCCVLRVIFLQRVVSRSSLRRVEYSWYVRAWPAWIFTLRRRFSTSSTMSFTRSRFWSTFSSLRCGFLLLAP